MLWIKVFPLSAVICWFAMLFYLPRLGEVRQNHAFFRWVNGFAVLGKL